MNINISLGRLPLFCSLNTRLGSIVSDCLVVTSLQNSLLLLLFPCSSTPSASYFQLVSSSSELGPRTRPASPPRGSEPTENYWIKSSLSVKNGGLWDIPRNISHLHSAFSHSQKLVNSKKTMQFLFLRNYSQWFIQTSCLNDFYIPGNVLFVFSVILF